MQEARDELSISLAEFLESHRFGKYRGVVKEIGTGDRLGMIRAQVLEVFGKKDLTRWARPSVPFAGAKHGWVSLPEKGDGVWIEFEAGDPEKPIWSGFWWADGELPEPSGVKTRSFVTSKGHKLVLDDEGAEVKLEHGEGPSIVLTGKDITLQVGTKKIVISSSGVDVNGGALEVR